MKRRAFTLIEILVVLGIIAVLVAMLFLGFGHVSRSTHANATHATLQTLRGMLTEYETSGGTVDKLESAYAAPIVAPTPKDFLTVGQPASELACFKQTRAVMLVLTAIPSNKKVLDSLPASTVKRDPNGPLLLDARGNPILYVPRQGIAGVYMSASPSAQTIVNKDRRHGFFYSAGEDADFSKGDDNIASFEQ